MSGDTERFTQMLHERAASLPFFKLIGLEVIDMEAGRSTTRLAWRPTLNQPAGIMHGGVIATLLDTGIAHALLPHRRIRDILEQGGSVVSVDLRVKFFRPVSTGTITCESRITRLGRRIVHGEGVVRNDDNREVARGDSIYTVISADQLAGAP